MTIGAMFQRSFKGDTIAVYVGLRTMVVHGNYYESTCWPESSFSERVPCILNTPKLHFRAYQPKEQQLPAATVEIVCELEDKIQCPASCL